jgi:CheY-like chemotaxis protein
MNPNLRILIVDDDQRMTRTLADILSLSGHEAISASSAAEAIKLVTDRTFDCILTDVRMPGMNGVEFHQQIRQSHPGIPVVLMTAYASDETIQRGLEEGIIGVLEKPLDMTHLLGFFSSLARQRTIAIVDDDPEFCRTLGDILQQRGFSVAQVTDPHEDVDLIASGSQTILLDMKLNSINGLEVLKSIRKRYPTIPVLLVTGYRDEMAEVVQAALQVNAFACLYKPLEIPDLLEKLRAFQLERLRKVIADPNSK